MNYIEAKKKKCTRKIGTNEEDTLSQIVREHLYCQDIKRCETARP